MKRKKQEKKKVRNIPKFKELVIEKKEIEPFIFEGTYETEQYIVNFKRKYKIKVFKVNDHYFLEDPKLHFYISADEIELLKEGFLDELAMYYLEFQVNDFKREEKYIQMKKRIYHYLTAEKKEIAQKDRKSTRLNSS